MAPPLPPPPDRPAREDYEHKRYGAAGVFLCYAPLLGQRYVITSERRTKADFAGVIKDLLDVRYPAAERVVLVMDNLNTHTPASRYEAFPPTEAKRLADRLEIHYAPKRGSWLNMAEIALSVPARQCLGQRLPDLADLRREVAAWGAARNAAGQAIDWRFSAADARIKLRRLYPTGR